MFYSNPSTRLKMHRIVVFGYMLNKINLVFSSKGKLFIITIPSSAERNKLRSSCSILATTDRRMCNRMKVLHNC